MKGTHRDRKQATQHIGSRNHRPTKTHAPKNLFHLHLRINFLTPLRRRRLLRLRDASELSIILLRIAFEIIYAFLPPPLSLYPSWDEPYLEGIDVDLPVTGDLLHLLLLQAKLRAQSVIHCLCVSVCVSGRD